MVELDLYAIFQLDLSATEADIRTKYKKLALKHHPDRGGDAAAFQELSKAYETLSDVKLREKYDKKLSAALQAKKRREERHRTLDAKRRKMKMDLVSKEKKAENKSNIDKQRQDTIRRLREIGMQQTLDLENYHKRRMANMHHSVMDRTLRVHSKVVYSEDEMYDRFKAYGEIELIKSTSLLKFKIVYTSIQHARSALYAERNNWPLVEIRGYLVSHEDEIQQTKYKSRYEEPTTLEGYKNFEKSVLDVLLAS